LFLLSAFLYRLLNFLFTVFSPKEGLPHFANGCPFLLSFKGGDDAASSSSSSETTAALPLGVDFAVLGQKKQS
jgi:hypothetical protein